jgi:hypothetical protein
MIKPATIYYYLYVFSILLVVNFVGYNILKRLNPSVDDDYALIKKYLLNDTFGSAKSNSAPFLGLSSSSDVEKRKPKCWIHVKHEINSRQWKSFYSKNTMDLNQPYLHLTIKSIIDNCGDDFNICLIDDSTFSHIIPDWTMDISKTADPLKTYLREYLMMRILHLYGGIIVPPSFLCKNSFKELYENATMTNVPFIFEKRNNTCDLRKRKELPLFVPDIMFMGAKKNDETVGKLVEMLKQNTQNKHTTLEPAFLGNSVDWTLEAVRNNTMLLCDGEEIGIKTEDRKPVLLDNLMEEKPLKIANAYYGVYIPADEILSRNKYQWFAILPIEDVLKGKMAVSRHLREIVCSSPFTENLGKI